MAATTNVANTSKIYRTPIPILRDGCACKMTPFYQESLPTENRTELIQQYTAMRLVHLTKTGIPKNSLDLNSVHHQLKLDALTLNCPGGASNILVCTVSFDCLITKPEGEARDYLTFDLKIPGVDKNTVFSFDNVARSYGSQKNLYAALKDLYLTGKKVVNPTNKTHGHEPEYNPNSPKHDQYIRHTEQMIAAYLATSKAALMLRNRLRAEIRGKYANATFVKVYNMGLHMHSTKTCCAPCEYTLLGLMNERALLMQPGRCIGFIANFKILCLDKNECLTFTFPRKSKFRVVVTVTAGETDADHRKALFDKSTKIGAQQEPPVYAISVKDPSVSTTIFTTLFTEKYDERRKPDFSTLPYRTVAISGSLSTKGSPGTINKVKSVNALEDKKSEDMYFI